jgi:hypothetical protein
MRKINSALGILLPSALIAANNDMASTLSIAYFANHDLLGVVTEEEYERFKSQLLQAFQEEWPDAAVTIDDDEEVYVETGGISGQAELDVRGRIADIVNEVIDSGEWQEEEEDFYEEEEDEIRDLEEKDDY